MIMPVDPTSISFESIKSDLITYIMNHPDYARWKDFYESSVGTIFLESMSAISSFLSFTAIANRKETFLHYGENRTSIIGDAQGLGYSAFRGRNPTVKLLINPGATGLTISKFDVIGTYEDYDLISLDTYILPSNVYTAVDVVVGILKEESNVLPSSDVQIFRFYSPDVSSDIQLFLDDTEVAVTSSLSDFSDIVEGSVYLAMSNVHGAVDVSYYNGVSDTSTQIGYTDGTTKVFYKTLPYPPNEGTLKIKINGYQVAQDDGDGHIYGTLIDSYHSSIEYSTGNLILTWATPPGYFLLTASTAIFIGNYPDSYVRLGIHQLVKGDAITFTGSNLPSPLVSGTSYYVRVRDGYSVYLFDTEAHALGNSTEGYIELTTTGSGTIYAKSIMLITAESNLPLTYSVSSVLKLKYVSLYRWIDDEVAGTTSDLIITTSKLTVDSTIGTSYVGNPGDGYTYPLILTNFQDKEALTSIVVNAPIAHETQLVIRGRNDYKKLLRTLISDCVSTNGYDVSAAIIDVTYTRSVTDDSAYKNMVLLTDAEEDAVYAELSTYTAMGILLGNIQHPVRVDCKLQINITLNSTSTLTSDAIRSDVEGILSYYEKILEQSLEHTVVTEYRSGMIVDVVYLTEIENKINQLPYVKVSRVELIDSSGSGSASLTELEWDEYYMMNFEDTTVYPIISTD
jgi:hypothetical protein